MLTMTIMMMMSITAVIKSAVAVRPLVRPASAACRCRTEDISSRTLEGSPAVTSYSDMEQDTFTILSTDPSLHAIRNVMCHVKLVLTTSFFFKWAVMELIRPH